MNILDGASVYWREIRRFYVFKKNSNKKEMVINAAVVAQKHCKYICDGINIICTLSLDSSGPYPSVYARPLNKKLPVLQVYDANGYPAAYPTAFPEWDKMASFYYWVRIQCWNYA